jgi:hypothetical protein
MTQFALFDMLPDMQSSLLELVKPSPIEGIIRKASLELFGSKRATYILECDGLTIEELYLSAQSKMSDGIAPERTELFMILGGLKPASRAIAMWYGDDYRGLPRTSRWDEFLLRLRRDLEGSPFGTSMLWAEKFD